MAVNYPYYIPQQQQPQYAAIPYAPQQRMPYVEQPQIGIKGRPVSSIEEVKATSIDFDGSVFFFPDLANKKIYTKQINLDGTSTLNVYELKNIPIETVVNPSSPAAVGDYNNVASSIFIDVPRGCCFEIAVKNVSTQTIDVQNANLIIERVA